jgi:hypothetical protein
MKKFIFTLLFSTLVFSSPSYAGWTKMSETVNGDTLYLDVDRIRKHDGYVYFWRLSDYLKPSEYGDLSAKVYMQGDCKLFRYKKLSASYHTDSMGNGTPSTSDSLRGKWNYPPPNSAIEVILNSVCSH